MIDEPRAITSDSFQSAWANVVNTLAQSDWEMRNLIVQIKNPVAFDAELHQRFISFCQQADVLGPKDVAYTIFPQHSYFRVKSAERLFQLYNKPNGMYDRLQRRYHNKASWGNYFRRMTHYETADGTVNQLQNVIKAIQTREKVNKAALTIVTQKPGGETTRPLGGPCLNYLAVQMERAPQTTLGLLAVYRNHDFLQKAYGNYWGLCHLLLFLAKETGTVAGPVTCVSSHAYVVGQRPALRAFVNGL
jgi:hypothetical protein